MKKNNKLAVASLIIFLTLFLVVVIFISLNKNRDNEEIVYPLIKNNGEKSEIKNITSDSNQKKEVVLPSKVSIEVPFTSQAPFANWDEYHEEACEEASIIMVKYFYSPKRFERNFINNEHTFQMN